MFCLWRMAAGVENWVPTIVYGAYGLISGCGKIGRTGAPPTCAPAARPCTAVSLGKSWSGLGWRGGVLRLCGRTLRLTGPRTPAARLRSLPSPARPPHPTPLHQWSCMDACSSPAATAGRMRPHAGECTCMRILMQPLLPHEPPLPPLPVRSVLWSAQHSNWANQTRASVPPSGPATQLATSPTPRSPL